MLKKICNHCGKLYDYGTQCKCRPRDTIDQETKRKSQKKYDMTKRNPDAVRFYHSDEWKRVRNAAYNRAYGLDEYLYYTMGYTVQADTVHHIEPRNERPDLQYDLKNLIAVSGKTHRLLHMLYHGKDIEDVKKTLREAVGSVRITPHP